MVAGRCQLRHFIAISSSFSGRNSDGLLFVSFIFCIFIGLRFRTDDFQIPPHRQAVTVGCNFMKYLLLIIISISLALLVRGQIVDISQASSSFFKRNDTLFLKISSMPFNGYINSDSSKTFYQDGVPSIDSPFSVTDNRPFWV